MLRKSSTVGKRKQEGWGDSKPCDSSLLSVFLGWMHSGYPIMCHLESVEELINEAGMRSRGLWGPIHELGHNQQQAGWEFPPHTTEATCNLWSVYVHETVLGIPRAQAHPALSPPEREKRIKAYLQKGAPLCDWNVWTALETYLQVQSRKKGARASQTLQLVAPLFTGAFQLLFSPPSWDHHLPGHDKLDCMSCF